MKRYKLKVNFMGFKAGEELNHDVSIYYKCNYFSGVDSFKVIDPGNYPETFEEIQEKWADDELVQEVILYDRMSKNPIPRISVERFKKERGIVWDS